MAVTVYVVVALVASADPATHVTVAVLPEATSVAAVVATASVVGTAAAFAAPVVAIGEALNACAATGLNALNWKVYESVEESTPVGNKYVHPPVQSAVAFVAVTVFLHLLHTNLVGYW